MRQKYLVKAGMNRYGRQQYLNAYVDDEAAWNISVVPVPMSKSKCNKIIKIAEQEILNIREKFPKKFGDNVVFEIIEYVDIPPAISNIQN